MTSVALGWAVVRRMAKFAKVVCKQFIDFTTKGFQSTVTSRTVFYPAISMFPMIKGHNSLCTLKILFEVEFICGRGKCINKEETEEQ